MVFPKMCYEVRVKGTACFIFIINNDGQVLTKFFPLVLKMMYLFLFLFTANLYALNQIAILFISIFTVTISRLRSLSDLALKVYLFSKHKCE